ncbi:MAG: hypothetical protein AAF266_15305 [Planctomycetota bacterium]
MKTTLHCCQLFAATVACLLLATDTHAQSGSGSRSQYQGSGSSAQGSGSATAGSGSGSRAMDVALDGYCAVCLTEKRDWVAGTAEYQVGFDGQSYRFPGTDQMAMFQADPTKYAPVLGGDDVVEYAKTGKRSDGKLAYGARHADRHYFFVSQANKDAFMAAPAQFANADVALGGACVVCQVDMRQQMAGNPQIAALHDGMRYFFVGAQQRDAFVANPAAYVSSVPSPNGSGNRGSGSGTRRAPLGRGWARG